MKKLFLICIIIYLSSFFGFSEEPKILPKDTTKNLSVSAGAVISHYFPTNTDTDLDWQTQIFSPGAEILIGYQLKNKVKIMTGLNYQYRTLALSNVYYEDKTKFHELSIPLICDFYDFILFKSTFYFTTGIYLGKYIDISRQTKGGKLSPDTNKWYDFPINDNSSDFICDYYFSLKYKPIIKNNSVFIETFFKYRLTEHWSNQNISKFMFGFKIVKNLN